VGLLVLFLVSAIAAPGRAAAFEPLFDTWLGFTVGYNPHSVTAGDLDGDEDLDLAVANGGSDTVSVLINLSCGTFQTHVEYGVGVEPTSVTTGDLDGDGDLDLAVANWYSDTVSVLINLTCTRPGPPSLVSPANGATNISTSPVLQWTSVPEATSYDVEVCTDSLCSLVVRSANVTETTWQVSPALNTATIYFWRARARNACGTSAWTPPWSFATGNCFIATAAFGTADSGKIDTLRAFRDRYLVATPLGKGFVEAYYSWSPPLAEYLSGKPLLRALVRLLLMPFVGLVSLLV